MMNDERLEKDIIDAYLGDEPLYRIDEGREAADSGHPMNTQRIKDHGVLVRVWPVRVDHNEG